MDGAWRLSLASYRSPASSHRHARLLAYSRAALRCLAVLMVAEPGVDGRALHMEAGGGLLLESVRGMAPLYDALVGVCAGGWGGCGWVGCWRVRCRVRVGV